AAERALAETLLAAEQRLLRTAGERGIGCTVLRPTLIYGGGPDRSLTPIARSADSARRQRVAPTGARGRCRRRGRRGHRLRRGVQQDLRARRRRAPALRSHAVALARRDAEVRVAAAGSAGHDPPCVAP